MTRIALVTGASGQDGGYLIELLLDKGYTVHAQSRRAPAEQWPGLHWHVGDIAEEGFIGALMGRIRPDEIYHLSSLSSPRLSWDEPYQTGMQNAHASHVFFDHLRRELPGARFFQASSSEIFGNSREQVQDEHTAPRPENPYAVAKLYAHSMAGLYRDRFGLFICSGILFNHESPRRPLSFVSQKIAYAAACIGNNILESDALDELGRPIVHEGRVRLGNLDVERDFGYAVDYVQAMWLMLQQSRPDDYVIGTGTTHSIRDFCEIAFANVGLRWRDHVEIDKRLVRPIDSRRTVADASKARRQLGWVPTTSFEELVTLMVQAQVVAIRGAKAGEPGSAAPV